MIQSFSIGDWVHTYIGWGLVVSRGWEGNLTADLYQIEFDNGSLASFWGNQLSVD